MCKQSLPCPPAGNTNTLQYMNSKLADIDKEKDKKSEGAVTPEERRDWEWVMYVIRKKKNHLKQDVTSLTSFNHNSRHNLWNNTYDVWDNM